MLAKLRDDVALFGSGRCASNLGIQGGDSRTQALGDHLRVVFQCGLRIGMPKVALHVLDSSMALHVRRRRPTKRLMGHIPNSGLFG